jgi:hypothetical protein
MEAGQVMGKPQSLSRPQAVPSPLSYVADDLGAPGRSRSCTAHAAHESDSRAKSGPSRDSVNWGHDRRGEREGPPSPIGGEACTPTRAGTRQVGRSSIHAEGPAITSVALQLDRYGVAIGRGAHGPCLRFIVGMPSRSVELS